MTMEICDNGHDKIVYDDDYGAGSNWHRKYCPLCKLQKEYDDKVEDLENQIQKLENKVDEQDAEIKDLKKNIRDDD